MNGSPFFSKKTKDFQRPVRSIHQTMNQGGAMNFKNTYFLIFSILFIFSSNLSQALPFDFSYSGRLVEASGKPVDGPVDIKLRFYRAESGGEPIAVDITTFTGVVLNEGVFQVTLSSLTDAQYHTVFSATEATWIEVTDVTNNIVYPRQKFSIVPYALKVPVDNSSITYNSSGALIFKPILTPTNGAFLKTDGSGNLSWATPSGGGDMSKSENLAGLTNAATARLNLGLENVENIALSTWVGTPNITTVGTIGAGTWHGTAIGDAYISSAVSWNGAATATTNATASNTNSTIVKRDGAGDFSAGTITANITGNVSGTAANVTGTVVIANGGTGQTSANAALNALLPTQTGNSGKVLLTDGTNTSWSTGGIISCPTNFTMIGASGQRGNFCITTDEQSAQTYLNAVIACYDLSVTGYVAHLCDLSEWHTACVRGSGLSNMTDDFEWVGGIEDNAAEAILIGNGGCSSLADGGVGNTYVYRCCVR